MTKVRLTALVAPLAMGFGLMLPIIGAAPASAASGVSYHFSSPPIASAGSIGPGQSLTFTLRVQDNGVPFPGGSVYLLYYQAEHVSGDSTTIPASQCGGVSVLPSNGSSVHCNADSLGNVALTYNVPAQPPVQGQAGWTAQSSPSGGTRAVNHYVYSTIYRFNPSPIAPSGSLAGGAAVPITFTAKDALSNPVANSPVYLSFRATAGGGSAAVGSTALTSTPSLFTADSNGAVLITYTAPSSLPSSGQDAIVAQDRTFSPLESNSDSYAFSPSTPVISVGDATVVEGDQQPGIPANFTVTISPVQPNPVTVQFVALCGIGDKECSEDFRQITSPVTITIPANTSSAVALVRQYSYIGGHAGETYNEGWFVKLANPSVGVLGRSVGTGMLLPDAENSSVALPYLYTGAAGVVPTAEVGGVPLFFTVTLGAVQNNDVTFDYATSDGSANSVSNYKATSGTAIISAGHTSAVVKVLTLPGAPPGSNLTFTLTISNATGGPTISGATGAGTIIAA